MLRAKTLVLGVSILLATTEVSAADVLPVRKGFYVQSDTPCEQTNNAVMFEYRGPQTEAGPVICTFTGGTRVKMTFNMKTNCVDRSSGTRLRSTAVYVVVDHLTMTVNGTNFRFCPVTALPAPWNKSAQ